MKRFTDREVEQLFFGIWGGAPSIKVVTNSVDEVRVRLSSMYSPPGLHFRDLLKLAKIFQTKNINDDEHFNREGCETCDYGSSYGFELSIRPEVDPT